MVNEPRHYHKQMIFSTYHKGSRSYRSTIEEKGCTIEGKGKFKINYNLIIIKLGMCFVVSLDRF